MGDVLTVTNPAKAGKCRGTRQMGDWSPVTKYFLRALRSKILSALDPGSPTSTRCTRLVYRLRLSIPPSFLQNAKTPTRSCRGFASLWRWGMIPRLLNSLRSLSTVGRSSRSRLARHRSAGSIPSIAPQSSTRQKKKLPEGSVFFCCGDGGIEPPSKRGG